ncbi:MAG: HEPN domain-containing protein [Cytophagales bacterium]
MKENSETIKQWIFKAEHDFKAINILLINSPELTDIICMHCQQCAEKYIKAKFIALHRPFPFVHDLLKLLNTLNEFNDIDYDVFKWADDIEGFGISIRYPSINGEPTFLETKDIIESTKNLRNYFRNLLKEYTD